MNGMVMWMSIGSVVGSIIVFGFLVMKVIKLINKDSEGK